MFVDPDARDPEPRDPEAFVPCLDLYTEKVWVNSGSVFDPEEEEKVLPVMALGFDYGGRVVRARGRRVLPGSEASDPAPREAARELAARRLLESFGPVEIACVDSVSVKLGSVVDYLLRTDGDPHALCSFSAYALPQLRRFGWRIRVADDYPVVVAEADPPFYAEVGGDEETTDWFDLELGVEVDGRRVNLLPGLIRLLESVPASARLDELSPSGARFFALPIDGNRFVTLSPERVRVLLKVLREIYQPEAGDRTRLRLPGLQAWALGEMDAFFAGPGRCQDGRPGISWRGREDVLSRGRTLHAAPTEEATPPRGLRATLRPYQRMGLAWLDRLRAADAGGILADDMGLGKTLQAIAHIVAEKEAGRLKEPVLVVAPTSLVGNWQRELARFAPYLQTLVLHGPGRHRLFSRLAHCEVAITTYPALLRDQARLEKTTFGLLLLDEAQAIKNPKSQAHRAVSALSARRRLCLSGTPVENSLSELWALSEFANPGLLGEAEWFAQRYTRPIEREGRTERLEDLRHLVAPFILRRTKEEVAQDLPPKTEIIRPVDLNGAQRDLYESIRLAGHAQVRRAIAENGLAASTVTILDALMKLRQVCCDPRLLPGEAARDVTASAKYDLLLELCQQQLAAGRRLLVFSQFSSMLALIGAGLSQAQIPFVSLTGATTNRQQKVDAFQSGKVAVFLISLKAGGTGLNLTAADTVIHYDPWWNPAAQAQATDRAHRLGQKKPVFVYNLIVASGVEERMLVLQRRKRQLAEGVLGRTGEGSDSASPSDGGRGGGGLPLSRSEVDSLFAPIDAPETGYEFARGVGAAPRAPAAKSDDST